MYKTTSQFLHSVLYDVIGDFTDLNSQLISENIKYKSLSSFRWNWAIRWKLDSSIQLDRTQCCLLQELWQFRLRCFDGRNWGYITPCPTGVWKGSMFLLESKFANYMSHFSFSCKMQCSLNLVLDSAEVCIGNISGSTELFEVWFKTT